MDKLVINVRDFSKTPGTRNKIEGLFSGEDFRSQVLNPKFHEALEKHTELVINLDRTAGYGTSWLEEVFGGLARKEGRKTVKDTLKFISEEEPYLIDDINGYIEDVKDAQNYRI